MRRRPSVGFTILIGTGVIWGTIGIAAKYLYEQSTLDSVSVTWLRAAIASPICIALAWRAVGKDLLKISRRDLTIMLLLGAMLIVYQFLYLAAITKLGVSASTLIALCSAPVLVAIASALLLDESLTSRSLGALTGAVIGTAMIVGWKHADSRSTHDTVMGVLLALGSALGIATHVFVSRSIAGRQHYLTPMAIGFPVGALVFTPLAIGRGFSLHLNGWSWLLLLFLAIGPSVIAYAMYQRGLQEVGATDASIVTLLEPLIAAVLAAILFNERLGWIGSAGAVLLLASIAVLTLTAEPAAPQEHAMMERMAEANL